jgi:hypothetical protein
MVTCPQCVSLVIMPMHLYLPATVADPIPAMVASSLAAHFLWISLIIRQVFLYSDAVSLHLFKM